MKKSYRCNNINGVNLFLADRSELKMNFNQTNLIKTEDYDAVSALSLLTLTNKWAEIADNLISHEAITSTSTTANNCINIKNNSTYNAYICVGGTAYGGNNQNNFL